MKITLPNYQESILNVTNSFLRYYKAQHQYASLPELDQILDKHSFNHVIYVLLDGLGMNVIEQHLQPTSAIRQYLHRPITSVFPPTTVAATDAVLSGVPPIVNGHIGWVQYYQQEDVHAVVFQNKDFYTGEVFTEDLRHKYFQFETMYDKIHKANPNIQTNEFFPAFREGGSDTFAEQIERVLLTTHNTDQSFNYVYWIEPDLTQHAYGTSSNETKACVQALNEDFTSLINNVADDTIVVLIADHGLVDVDIIPLFEYQDVTSHFIRKPAIEPRVTTFFIKEGHESTFEEAFTTHFGSYFELYKTSDFLQKQWFGEGEIHPNVMQCFGNYISVATSLCMFGLHEGKGYKAHHAGLSAEEMMVPLVIYYNQKKVK